MSHTVTGKIISEKYSNNKFTYTIEDKENSSKREYGYFTNGNINNRISPLFEITISYDTVERYGKKFNNIKTVEYGAVLKNTKNIEDLLIMQVKFTKGFTKKVIDKFGEDVMRVLIDEPELLKEIVHRGKDIELGKLKRFTEDMEKFRMYSYLSSLGIKSKYHEGIINLIGHDRNKLREIIYEMKMPFDMCDKAALSMGYEKNSPERIGAFNEMMMKNAMNKGQLYIDLEKIKPMCVEYEVNVKDCLEKMIKMGDYYTSKRIYEMEKYVERFCMKLMRKDVNNNYEYDDTAKNNLDPSQGKAIEMIMNNGISIVNGGAGTGKTYTVAKCVNEMLEKKVLVFILAPTGAAVERIRSENELKKVLDKMVFVSTIHSFLYSFMSGNNLKFASEIYDEIVVCIDEMSMVDLKLFYKLLSLLESFMKKIRMVLLGDYNQLPSIGGGKVLRDLIDVSIDYNIKFKNPNKWDSNKMKYISLQVNHRQSGKRIYENGENILRCENIEPDDEECIYVKISEINEVVPKMMEVLGKYKIDYSNSCIIAPTNRMVAKINNKLQEYYNPDGKEITDELRIGDKVMQTKNDKKKEVYNGSILLIDDVIGVGKDIPLKKAMKSNDETIKVKCEYYPNDNGMKGGLLRMYNAEELDKLRLAYSFTVHKSQGKGYDTVIVVIHSSMEWMLNKNILYTAVTRAKKRCIIIGDKEGLKKCKREMEERVTGLFKNVNVSDTKKSERNNEYKEKNM